MIWGGLWARDREIARPDSMALFADGFIVHIKLAYLNERKSLRYRGQSIGRRSQLLENQIPRLDELLGLNALLP